MNRGQIGPMGAALLLGASGLGLLNSEVEELQRRQEREVYLRHQAKMLGLVDGLSLPAIEEVLRVMNEEPPSARLTRELLEQAERQVFKHTATKRTRAGVDSFAAAAPPAGPSAAVKHRALTEKKARRAKRKQRRQR